MSKEKSLIRILQKRENLKTLNNERPLVFEKISHKTYSCFGITEGLK